MPKSEYTLVPEAIPAVNKATVYQNVLDDFIASSEKSVRVEIPKKRPSTVHRGLLTAKRTNARFAAVGIVRRADAIYLRK